MSSSAVCSVPAGVQRQRPKMAVQEGKIALTAIIEAMEEEAVRRRVMPRLDVIPEAHAANLVGVADGMGHAPSGADLILGNGPEGRPPDQLGPVE